MRTTGPTPMLAAISGFACIVIGAYGRHALSDPHARELVEIGTHYQFMHTMAALACVSFCNWGAKWARLAAPCFLIGALVFSGPLYLMALGAPRWLGAATPIGGGLFLLGWIILIASGWSLFSQHRTRHPFGAAPAPGVQQLLAVRAAANADPLA